MVAVILQCKTKQVKHFKKTAIMAKISLTDVIHATLRLRGMSLATINVSGVSSFSEILSRLMAAATGAMRGLATVELRNTSQGWSTRRNVMVNFA